MNLLALKEKMDALILYEGSLAELHQRVDERYFLTNEVFVECRVIGRKPRDLTRHLWEEPWWDEFYEQARAKIAEELVKSGYDGLVNYKIIERRTNEPRVIFKGVPIVKRAKLNGHAEQVVREED